MKPVRPHYDAVLARLEADPVLAGNVVDIADPAYKPGLRPPPYVVIEGDLGTSEYGRLSSSEATEHEFEYQLIYVGEDGNQCRAWAELCQSRLMGWTPAVPGWKPSALRNVDSTSAQRDTSYNPPLIYASDTFALTTRKG